MSKKRQALSRDEIDDIVIRQAEDDSAWEEPVHANRSVDEEFFLPAELAARASFLARLHKSRVEEWLTRVIQERVELEEASFVEAKRALMRVDKAALDIRVPYKDSLLRKKLAGAHSPEEYALVFAQHKPSEMAEYLGFKVMEHYLLKVGSATGIERKFIDKAVENLNQALEIKRSYER
ncbi:MAG: hypothetical protein ACJ76N_02360 [Thermoanaerobaculia bacterium]